MVTFRATFTVEVDAADLSEAVKWVSQGVAAIDACYDGLEVVDVKVRLQQIDGERDDVWRAGYNAGFVDGHAKGSAQPSDGLETSDGHDG